MKTLAPTLVPSLVVTCLLWCPALIAAQAPSPDGASEPKPGDRLAVSYVTDRLAPQVSDFSYRRTVHMEFIALDGGRLMGRDGDRLVAIDTVLIRSVRRRIGTKPASAPTMVLGSAVGFAAGFVVGAMAGARSRAWSQDPDGGMSTMNRGLATGVLLGAPAGALVAWLTSRSRPIYEEVQIGRARPSVVLNGSGRLGLSLSIATP
jgi:hypothetical protein